MTNQEMEKTMHNVITRQTKNLIGPITQKIMNQLLPKPIRFPSLTEPDVTQNIEATNDCDEENTDFNFAQCHNDIDLLISLTQVTVILQINDARFRR